MPADVDSIAALGELASARDGASAAGSDDQVTVAVPRTPHDARRAPAAVTTARPGATRGRSAPADAFAAVRALPRRTQLVALASGSVAAGLLAGLVVPVAAAAPVTPAASAAAVPTVLSLPTGREARATTGASSSGRSGSTSAPASPRPATPATSTAHAASTTVARSGAARPATAVSLAAALPAIATASGIAWPADAHAAARPARAAVARPSAVEAPPTRPSAETIADARAYKPTRKLPAASGAGRRIVYSQHRGHVWIVGVDGRVVRDYPVTGRIGRPAPGSYRVFSKSPTAVNPTAKVRFDLMVRFAHGITGAAIGFHTIPRWFDGRPIQRENQLGEMIGAGGCVRQSKADARWLYSWAKVGERVVVLR